MRAASRAAVFLGVAWEAAKIFLCVALVALVVWLFMWAAFSSAHAKNWDRDAATTEQGRIRSEYLSRAGTLPSYKYDPEIHASVPDGATYHGNCCGEADAYEADEVFVDAAGATWAILTCNDPDDCREVEGKVVRPPGTKWKVPPEKVLLNFNPTNNTGHGWVYISPTATDGEGTASVLCWAAPPGS